MTLSIIFVIILLDIIICDGENIMRVIEWVKQQSKFKQKLIIISTSLTVVFTVNMWAITVTDNNYINVFYKKFINKQSTISVSPVIDVTSNVCLTCSVMTNLNGEYYVSNPVSNYKVSVEHGKLDNIYVYDVFGNDNTKKDLSKQKGVAFFGREPRNKEWLQANKVTITNKEYKEEIKTFTNYDNSITSYQQELNDTSSITYEKEVYISIASDITKTNEDIIDGKSKEISLITPYVFSVVSNDNVEFKFVVVIVSESKDNDFTSQLYMFENGTFTDVEVRTILSDLDYYDKCVGLETEDLNNACSYYSESNAYLYDEYNIDEFVREVNLVLD